MAFSDKLIALLNEVKVFQEANMPHQLWYRGQGVDKPLHSSLFRTNYSSIEKLKNTERNAYFLFRNLGYSLLNKQSDIELLTHMQHYGVKTRLLDWTTSLLFAVFFAVESGESPVIWMLSPEKMNKIMFNEEILPTPPFAESYEDAIGTGQLFPHTVAFTPIKNSPRLLAQQGFFTMQGDSGNPLELEKNGQLIHAGISRKLEIDSDLATDLKWYLNLNSINTFVIYPDLDGLSKHLNKLCFRDRAL
ncbi:hypothetical protein Back11_30880 [Paenibacillus baekrokdamisoli]|uniref:Uncharacterized protein n=1 Tax=Paenibacillus baekrokdamisoli TaxID=1712516 RepID=A0A3G9JA19_9BACL|nr:FRG domain-containing protein [Paenibacillus baekrokdamisoli]MBB3071748.1 hypothetical protein [Paenibacillus baekrokdamisoli]BBH21743.1 hypothetical protein Back11_30880 [Paenibacillus baekrokdamisoli]